MPRLPLLNFPPLAPSTLRLVGVGNCSIGRGGWNGGVMSVGRGLRRFVIG